MKKLICLVLLSALFSNLAFGDCDWSKIKKLPNGDYAYNPLLNICVGKLVQDSQVKEQQVQDLNKAITLKDLAIKDSDARTVLWQKSSNDELDRVQKMESDQKIDSWLYFGLGILTTSLAIWGATQIIK